MRLAVLGATGAVGRTMLRVLEERRFPADALVPLASPRSRGAKLVWRGREWRVEAPEPGVFRGCDVALFSAGGERSREWAPRAADEGAVVVDNSSAWRLDPGVPLVVPEVNAARIRERPRNIVANPNCAAIQLVVALEAIRRAAGLRRVLATTFQSVSGAGQKGIAALEAELAGAQAQGSPFAAAIAGNVIPCIGPRRESGWNEEEQKIRNESRKILGLPGLAVAATCVRVPVRIGHSIAATVETEQPLPLEAARAALRAMPGLELVEGAHDPLPRDVAGLDVIRVGRLRADPDLPNVLHFWVVADNLRKGAATNAVQIAEQILRE
ncbi:MAG: aspartate-semialdehyde dehydrogenase [Gemmatimonadetes bacterium]|nr:aspartate-semialdehyde dehydrogenase [Gemmatimonadota bacterium]